ncbi:MAG: tetratricopeptide repeat protein [Candidatus Peribacteraceae bacterium]|jgi:tetratricopeptide (TPR) repeat protein
MERSLRHILLLAAVAAGLAALFFLPVLWNDFVDLDDFLLIVNNPAVQELSHRSMRRIFTSYDPELYIPFTLLSYQIEHALFGFTPAVFHLTSLVLHALNTALVFAAAYLLSARRKWAAFACALLFALHPLQVEAVAWASARKDVLSAFFFLLSLTLYLWSEGSGKKNVRWASIATFAGGLLSKASVLPLPVILFAYLWKERKLSRASAQRLIPYVALSALFFLIALGGKTRNISSLPAWQQLLLFFKGIAFSLQKAFLPWPLVPLYQQPAAMEPLAPDYLVPLLLVPALALALFFLRKNRSLVFGAAFFFLLFLPSAATFMRNGMVFYFSDRYTYLALIGIFFPAGLAADRLYAGLRGNARKVALGAGVAAIAALGFLTLRQQRVWESSETLYLHTVRIHPGSMAYANLSILLYNEGKKEEAKAILAKAIAFAPEDPRFLPSMALVAEEEGNVPEALEILRHAAELLDRRPIYSMQDLRPYYQYGELLQREGRVTESIAVFEHAVTRAPELAEPHYNLGLQYQLASQPAKAEPEFARAAELYRYHLSALYHLAGVQAEQGKLAEAIATLERLTSMDPGFEKAQEHLVNLRRMVQLGGSAR